jgi:aryl-alcohol dehydrogenase-like predicted oxidoreductase
MLGNITTVREERLGAALRGRLDQVILMTKVCTHGRDKNIAMQMLEESLKRLRTDHLDIWQIHEVVYENDPDLIFRRVFCMTHDTSGSPLSRAARWSFCLHR